MPSGNDQTVYFVGDDFGKNGSAWRETDCDTSDLETVIRDLLTGQYSNPIRVVAFIAHELRGRCDQRMRDIPLPLHDFTDRYEGRYRDVQLPLPMRLV